jgi:hypothetical protein
MLRVTFVSHAEYFALLHKYVSMYARTVQYGYFMYVLMSYFPGMLLRYIPNDI